MQKLVFTAITFSPVTEFIEKTRKLRDLYGSSFILSYLADSVCREATRQLGQDAVVSPALLNITMGTPDQIIIRGDFSEEDARASFLKAWSSILDTCRQWICDNCKDWINLSYEQWINRGEWHRNEAYTLPWDRSWQAWQTHAWETFWVQAESIPQVLNALTQKEERYRNWVGVNWLGESSTLSGADAIAWPGLDRNIPPKQRRISDDDIQIREFFQTLNQKIGEAILEDDLSNYRHDLESRLQELVKHYGITVEQRQPNQSEDEYIRQELARSLGEAIITNREQLNIPELTKRLFTLRAVAKRIPNSKTLLEELPNSFREVNLWKTDQPMGWFRGDGDQASRYICTITRGTDVVRQLHDFSQQMRQWGKFLKQSFDQRLGRVIIAGGDDFLGVFYPTERSASAIDWLCSFKENVWHRGEGGRSDRKPITPSVGFVWASSQVPQRDILQHCELAERAAKDGGRDRVCLRVLFSSGTYLEWTCPWWLLPKVVKGYRDRNSQQDWTAFSKDVASLKARHAFRGNHQVALALFNLFFTDLETGVSLLPADSEVLFDANSPLFTQPGTPETLTGIFSEDIRAASLLQQQEAFNEWVIALAEVGFQLFN
jgi:CRISPR-associated protein Cmr2